MIPSSATSSPGCGRKPRASGDDPVNQSASFSTTGKPRASGDDPAGRIPLLEREQ